jgi:ferritin-like metal-binding protein YciE
MKTRRKITALMLAKIAEPSRQSRIDKEAPKALPAIEKHLRAAHNHLVDVDNIVSSIWGHGSREQKAVRAALTKIQKL